MFIYQKIVDRSTLRQGFQIPVEFHPLLAAMPGGMPVHGETRNITIIVDGEEYKAQLKNQGFDRERYDGHADVIQVRYSEKSPIVKKLRTIFYSTWNYVEAEKSLPENIHRRYTIKVPKDRQEYLAISCSDIANIFIADYITSSFKSDAIVDLASVEELDFEIFKPREDVSAGIIEKERIQKVRHLDRSIGDSLKRLYDFHCQMTGERVGDSYNALVVEAHHIIPFTTSLNNDTSNIIIVSPSYHRIIHAAKPEWDPDKLAFKYPNGLIEKVKINKHLVPR